jgi:TRAP-type uncharacterized transport system substrate-binding protein
MVRLSRRAALAGGIAAGAFVLAAAPARAHTPYNQWRVYRKRHLIIVASKRDPAAYDLARSLAGVLAEQLPESRSLPSRAGSAARVASLLVSGQMDVAVLSRRQAATLRDGTEEFQGYGPVDLHALFAVGGHLLVCRADFPAPHAYLLAEALQRNRDRFAPAPARVPGEAAVPVHPGAAAFIAAD